VKKPAKRPDLPRRHVSRDKRRLRPEVDAATSNALLKSARYVGSPKHKLNPEPFGLEPFAGKRGDATLCDRDAGFTPAQIASIHGVLQRGIRAGLIGTGRIIWAIGDNGWIYECRLTNRQQSEYHGYPVRSSEPIAQLVYRRFLAWAERHGTQQDRQAATQCQALYGFKT